MELKQEIDCLSCIHKKVCIMLLTNKDKSIDYKGDIGKKNNCENYKYVNYEYYVKEDFQEIIIDKIKNQNLTASDLLIINSILKLLENNSGIQKKEK